ncbi:hypothetical protein, partial [Salmonella enterica]|uniref:hypothetical protein n=2 Tax=Bacteria TaxID=2 RepID=UPI0021B17313
AVVIAYEAAQITEWVGSGAAKALLDTDRWWEPLWAGAWPWLLLNLALGLLLLPVTWSIRRRRIAEMVRRRTIPDVLTQE